MASRLVRRARGGCTEALNQILDAIRPSLIAAARNGVRHAPDANDAAEDVVQDALVRIVRYLPSCQSEDMAHFTRWAYMVTRNCMLRECDHPYFSGAPGRYEWSLLDSPDEDRDGRPRRAMDIEDTAALAQLVFEIGCVELDEESMFGNTETSDHAGDHICTPRFPPSNGCNDSGHRASRCGAAPDDAPPRTVRECVGRVFSEVYDSLPSHLASVISVRDTSDGSWEEVGRNLGITGSAAKCRYQRAVTYLSHRTRQRLRALARQADSNIPAELAARTASAYS